MSIKDLRSSVTLETGPASARTAEKKPVATDPPAKSRKRTAVWLWLCLLLVALIGAPVGFNALVVDGPVQGALGEDSRNTTVSVHVYHRWAVSPREIVFDIWDVGPEASAAAVTRTLLVAAETLQDRDYDRVHLAFRGSEKFWLAGDDFRALGKRFSTGFAVADMAAIPEKLKLPSGISAFGSWSGGWLGVIGKQLEDLNDWHRQWWQRSALGLE